MQVLNVNASAELVGSLAQTLTLWRSLEDLVGHKTGASASASDAAPDASHAPGAFGGAGRREAASGAAAATAASPAPPPAPPPPGGAAGVGGAQVAASRVENLSGATVSFNDSAPLLPGQVAPRPLRTPRACRPRGPRGPDLLGTNQAAEFRFFAAAWGPSRLAGNPRAAPVRVSVHLPAPDALEQCAPTPASPLPVPPPPAPPPNTLFPSRVTEPYPSLLLPLPMSLLYTPYCCPYPCPYCTLPLLTTANATPPSLLLPLPMSLLYTPSVDNS